MRKTFTTPVWIEGKSFEVELDLDVVPAEPDVGLFGEGIDDWAVTSVNGDTSDEVCSDMYRKIEAEYGDECFVEKLYEEGACDD
jgi:hypothetical protein